MKQFEFKIYSPEALKEIFAEKKEAQKITIDTFQHLCKEVLKREVEKSPFLTISFTADAPVAFSERQLYREFIAPRKQLIENFVRQLSLDTVVFKGLPKDISVDIKGVENGSLLFGKVPHLSFSEFDRLLNTFEKSVIDSTVWVSIFVNETSYDIYKVPCDMKMGELFEKLSTSCEFNTLFSQEAVLKEETVGNRDLHLVNSDYTLHGCDGILFPFPLFNRFLDFKKTKNEKDISPCINCRSCATYCPEGLHPSPLYHYLGKELVEEAENIDLKRCTLCNKCNFVCPSHIPLTKRFATYFREEEEANNG